MSSKSERKNIKNARKIVSTREKQKLQLMKSKANRQMGYQSGRSNLPASFYPHGCEVKAVDIARAAYLFRSPGSATNVVLLNAIQNGAGFYNRVGSRVEMKNLHIRGVVGLSATATTGNLRLIIVYDRQPTGALPTIATLLQSRDQTGASANGSSAEINLENRDRWQIVRDMQWYAPAGTYTAGVVTNQAYPGVSSHTWDVNEFIKLKGLGVHFNSTANPVDITNIATGALYAFFVADNDSVYTASVGFRLRYNDC